jgi:hypothetical protein
MRKCIKSKAPSSRTGLKHGALEDKPVSPAPPVRAGFGEFMHLEPHRTGSVPLFGKESFRTRHTLETGGSVRCIYSGYGWNRDRRRWHRLQTLSVKAKMMQKLMRRLQNLMQNNAKNNAGITRNNAGVAGRKSIGRGLGVCIYGSCADRGRHLEKNTPA